MASKKSPGMAPLGHDPFAYTKIKLEGPKRHHDDHGPNASVPAKGDVRAVPNKHWEVQYRNIPSDTMLRTGGADFCPKRSQDRATTHSKINSTDH